MPCSEAVEGHSTPNDNALLRIVLFPFADNLTAHCEIGLVTHSGYKDIDTQGFFQVLGKGGGQNEI